MIGVTFSAGNCPVGIIRMEIFWGRSFPGIQVKIFKLNDEMVEHLQSSLIKEAIYNKT